MHKDSFATIVHRALSTAPVRALLKTRGAVILERIARGGGATKWYYCSDQQCLEDLELALSPGSVVSFYFDGRIRRDVFSQEIVRILEDKVDDAGELLVGAPESGSQSIDMEIISGRHELIEYLSTVSPGTPVFYGLFPARDSDGVNAVTVSLPDIDGVVRPHPH